MSLTSEKQGKELQELEDVISKAIKKVRGTKENDLCKYIPVSSGGYIHHFTLRKMKYKELKAISKEELNEKLKQIKMDLIKTNAQVATGTTPKNSGSIRSMKKTIAKI